MKARQTFGHFEVDTMQSGKKRGSNEILNRYVRRFIPKERKIETVSNKELDQINHWSGINPKDIRTIMAVWKCFIQY